jgi:hypothetical protein
VLAIRTVFADTDMVTVDNLLDVVRAHHALKIIIVIHTTPPCEWRNAKMKNFSVVDF